MSDIEIEGLNTLEYDVLREIGNIGAGNATTALSQLINSKINMNDLRVKLYEFKELAEIVGGAETQVVGILIALEGDIQGDMMFMLECECAHSLVRILLGGNIEDRIEDSNKFDDMEMSALGEIGNIITGAYLSSLSTLTHLCINTSVPNIAIDMAGAILSVPAIEFGKMGDKALLIQSQFIDGMIDISGYFILIPTLESYSVIMKSLGL